MRELTCRELTEFLADYFARELSPDERSIFEGHLGECLDCVAYLRSYAETMRLAKDAYDDDQIPAGVPDVLVRAIIEARKRAPPFYGYPVGHDSSSVLKRALGGGIYSAS